MPLDACQSLTAITIPQSVATIGDGCICLIVISLTSINDTRVRNHYWGNDVPLPTCTSLDSVTAKIPKASITTLKASTFSVC